MWGDLGVATSELGSLFEDTVNRVPHSMAVVDSASGVSYAELNGYADKIASVLHEHSVRKGDRVGLLGDRTKFQLAAVLACWKIGAGYLPLDPDDPESRRKKMLVQAGVRVLLDATTSCQNGMHAFDITRPGDMVSARCNRPKEIAYTLYTSGSTGSPLAVDVRQDSVRRLLYAISEFLRRAFGTAPRRVAVNAPATFDASVKQLVHVLTGATLVLVPEAARRNPAALGDYLSGTDVDLVDITPAHLRMLLLAEPSLAVLDRTRLLIGGEAIDEDLVTALNASRVSGFAGVYGTTECCVDSMAATSDELPGLGRPLSGVPVWVCAPDGTPVRDGVEGEILIGGWGVSDGYLDAPEETTRRFVPRPDHRPGQAFRSGDVGVRDERGTFRYIGRLDDQVKIGGRRAHLSEVTSALLRSPEIAAAAVIPDGGSYAPFLRAFVVPTGDPAVAHRAADAQVEAWLPPFMRPREFVVVNELPITRRGKVDRARLATLATGDSPEALSGEAEPLAYALDAFRQVVGTDPIDPDDDFFLIGGDSITAVQLIRGVEQKTGQPIGLVRFLADPTPRHLAALLGERTG